MRVKTTVLAFGLITAAVFAAPAFAEGGLPNFSDDAGFQVKSVLQGAIWLNQQGTDFICDLSPGSAEMTALVPVGCLPIVSRAAVSAAEAAAAASEAKAAEQAAAGKRAAAGRLDAAAGADGGEFQPDSAFNSLHFGNSAEDQVSMAEMYHLRMDSLNDAELSQLFSVFLQQLSRGLGTPCSVAVPRPMTDQFLDFAGGAMLGLFGITAEPSEMIPALALFSEELDYVLEDLRPILAEAAGDEAADGRLLAIVQENEEVAHRLNSIVTAGIQNGTFVLDDQRSLKVVQCSQ